MVDNRASHLVRRLTAKAQDKAISKQQVKRCSCDCCQLVATIDFGGHDTCTYHSQQDWQYWPDITMAINNNIDLIKKHAKMTRWNIKDWAEQHGTLSQFYFCPMTELDKGRPTIYLNKFSKALRKKILDEASGIGDQHG
jgi:hypothetical protein